MTMKILGRILCWMGLHSWYEGLTCCYCSRCEEILYQLYDDTGPH